MATTPEGRKKHQFSIAYEGGWGLEELENWLAECRLLGAESSTVIRAKAKSALSPSGLVGLYVLLPLPTRDAGSSTDGLVPEGGGTDGETSS